MSRKQYPQLTEMAKARLAPCVADIFCLCSGFRGRDEDGLGEKRKHAGTASPRVASEKDVSSPAPCSVARRRADSGRKAANEGEARSP